MMLDQFFVACIEGTNVIPNLPNPVLIAGRDERGEESPMGKRQDMEMPIPRRSRGDSA